MGMEDVTDVTCMALRDGSHQVHWPSEAQALEPLKSAGALLEHTRGGTLGHPRAPLKALKDGGAGGGGVC